jgi:penicillin-binding protein 2
MPLVEREPRFTQNRLHLFRWGAIAVFVFLISGFWRLQILQPDYFIQLSDQNSIKNLPTPAPRGRILDRNGRVIVDNYPSFSIIAQAESSSDFDAHLPRIAEGFGIDLGELKSRVEVARGKNPYGHIVIRENATRAEITFVETHRREYPELDLLTVPRRNYPAKGMAAHMIGYVGEISEHDLDQPEWALMRLGAIVGKSGIERQYDYWLRGDDGFRRVVVDSLGNESAVLDELLPTPGKDLRLTIDLDVQEAAEANFLEDSGAIVALDPRTGGVLAMVSRPVFDPNLFATGISSSDWNQIISDPSNPLLNRAIQAQLAPGSVQKIIMATAGLETGTIDGNTSHYCGGGATFYGRYFRCWNARGHGSVNIIRAMAQSCDVFFYTVGRDMGIDKMAEYSSKFGLGKPTGIDLPNEAAGTVPSPEWKQRRFHEPWYAGETISVAIGQGALTVTPVQLAYAVGGITSGGVFYRPRLVGNADLRQLDHPSATDEDAQSTGRREVPLAESTVQLVTDAIYAVVNQGGTGSSARVPGLDIAGKTGTAQVASLNLAKGKGKAGLDLRDNGWFVGLAPRRNPEIVVSVLYQSGEHGAAAAPAAREVIKAYFGKKRINPGGGPTMSQVRPTSGGTVTSAVIATTTAAAAPAPSASSSPASSPAGRILAVPAAMPAQQEETPDRPTAPQSTVPPAAPSTIAPVSNGNALTDAG